MKLKIHPLFFIFGLYFALIGKVFLFLTFTLTALIHEYGHAIALEKLGYKMNNVSLMPYGAVANADISGISYKDELIVAFAGPFTNLVTAIFFIALWWVIPSFYTYTDTIVMCNLSIAFLNFIPCYPLDGGRMLSSTLALKTTRKKAMKTVRILGIIFSIALFALFIYSIIIKNTNISILFFALFMLVGSLSKSKQSVYIRMFERFNCANLKTREIKKIAISEKTILKELIALCDSDKFVEISILNREGKTIKYLNITKTQMVISTYRLYDRVYDIAKDLEKDIIKLEKIK